MTGPMEVGLIAFLPISLARLVLLIVVDFSCRAMFKAIARVGTTPVKYQYALVLQVLECVFFV